MPGNHMGIARFKSQVRRGLALPSDYRVLKTLPVLVENAGARRKRFIISTESVDRDNDTIALRGWVLDSFARNPVVFYNHETYGYPIGKAVEIGVSGSALKSVVEFMPSTVPNGAGEAAEAVWQMVEGGFLCAASVGFRPLEYTTAKSRMSDDDWWPALDFTKVELMEWSVVGIPANPDAVADSDERAAMVELQSLELTRRSASAGGRGKTAAEIEAGGVSCARLVINPRETKHGRQHHQRQACTADAHHPAQHGSRRGHCAVHQVDPARANCVSEKPVRWLFPQRGHAPDRQRQRHPGAGIDPRSDCQRQHGHEVRGACLASRACSWSGSGTNCGRLTTSIRPRSRCSARIAGRFKRPADGLGKRLPMMQRH